MKLAGCHRITDDSLIPLVRSCPVMLELDIASVPQLRSTSIYGMWLNTIHLRELKMGKNLNINSDAFPDLPFLYGEMTDDLVDSSNPAWVSYLERQAGDAESGRRNRASTVDSYIDRSRDTGTPRIDINHLRPLAPTFDLLRVIDLTGCTELNDLALVNLVNSAPKLRNLTLAKCGKLTDVAMEAIAKLGKQLHYLHLGHVEK
jgi:F-box and leucine-rich repeat protein GRR1